MPKPAHKKRLPKYRAYVAFLPFPNNPTLKVELIAITDETGRVVQGFHGPSPIGDLIDTSEQGETEKILRERLKELFDFNVNLRDIHILPFYEVEKMLSGREGRSPSSGA